MKAGRKKFRAILDIPSVTLSAKTQSKNCLNFRENGCVLMENMDFFFFVIMQTKGLSQLTKAENIYYLGSII